MTKKQTNVEQLRKILLAGKTTSLKAAVLKTASYFQVTPQTAITYIHAVAEADPENFAITPQKLYVGKNSKFRPNFNAIMTYVVNTAKVTIGAANFPSRNPESPKPIKLTTMVDDLNSILKTSPEETIKNINAFADTYSDFCEIKGGFFSPFPIWFGEQAEYEDVMDFYEEYVAKPHLILEIELVPPPLWGKNKHDEADWKTHPRADHCEICGSKELPLHLHEKYVYDDVNHIQTQVGLWTLCKMCHHVKHLGLANKILAPEGYQAVIKHAIKVNGITPEQFEEHRRDKVVELYERCFHEWKQVNALPNDSNEEPNPPSTTA